MINDELSIADIVNRIKQNPALSEGYSEIDMIPLLLQAIRNLSDHDLLFLRHPDTVSIRR